LSAPQDHGRVRFNAWQFAFAKDEIPECIWWCHVLTPPAAMKHAWLLAVREDREEMTATASETYAVTEFALENKKAGHAAAS
jgi:hypothetical protein